MIQEYSWLPPPPTVTSSLSQKIMIWLPQLIAMHKRDLKGAYYISVKNSCIQYYLININQSTLLF